MFGPIEKKRYYQVVADKLRSLIDEGVLKPGDVLPPERELAQNFKVSRHTIREAVNQLQSEGLLKTVPGKGTFVLEPNALSLMYDFTKNMLQEKDNPAHLLEVRQIIEIQAAKIAATRANKQDIEKMRNALKVIKEEADSGVVGDKSDLDFHLFIADATHNPVLVIIMNTISDLFKQCLKQSSQKRTLEPEGPKLFYEDHKKIFEEIENGNSEGAEQAMKKHLDRVRKEYIKYNFFKNVT